MGTFRRSSSEMTAGWVPSQDLVNGSPAGLLRADNLQLDDLGVLSLRLGSDKSVPNYPGPVAGGEQNVDSMFVGALNSSPTSLSVKRVVGVDGSVYINGARRDSGIAGSGDISFGAYQGQIFWARSTRRRKNDGTESGGDDGRGTRGWGIPAPSVRPTLEITDPDGRTFSTCNGSETPGWEASEGSVAAAEGHDGTPDGAILLTPDEDSGRSTATRIFGGAQDFTAYDGGDTGIPEDLIEGYILVTNPENLTGVTIMFDCGPDAPGLFQEDYYYYTLTPNELTSYKTSRAQSLGTGDVPTIDMGNRFFDMELMRSRLEHDEVVDAPKFEPRKDADWARFAIPRKSFVRNGATPNTGWDTLMAVRLVFESFEPDSTFGEAHVDNLTISGGANHPFTGTYVFRYQWKKQFSNYVALSPASPASNEVTLKANGVRVRIPSSAGAARDPQVDEVRVFCYGGALNQYYMFGESSISGSTVLVDVNKREVQAVLDNITLNLALATPPDDIISIAGPYYDRLLTLTPAGVHLSQQLNPDTFSTDEVIRIGDGAEVPQWMVVSDGRVLVGTTAEIWEITGTLVRFPDGTLDARKRPLNVPGATDRAVAQDGPVVAYLSANGPRLLVGGTSKQIVGNIDLLLRGQTRYGVPNMDLGLAPGRTRFSIVDRFLYMIAPETGYGDGSPVLYRYDIGDERWWRRTYPATFRSLFRAPANQLYAGDNAGQVWALETGTTDAGAAISYTAWTVSEAPGGPLIRKDFHDLIVNCNSGSSPATVEFHADQSTSATISTAAAGTEASPLHQVAATALNGARRVQLRISGSSTTGFKFYDYTLNYRERPMARVLWDTGFPALASSMGRELVWFRRLNLVALSDVDLQAAIYFQGTLHSTYDVTVTPGQVDVYWIPIGREVKGRQPRIVIQPKTAGEEETAFELYKLGFQLRNTGQPSEMQFVEFAPES